MSSSESIRIAIVEDLTDVREGLKYFLSMEPTFSVLKPYENAEALLSDLQRGKIPDVVLMDIELPGMTGIEATGKISLSYPDISVLILTIFEHEEKILQSIRAGARGYILKNTKPQALIDQIKSLSQGGSPISPAIAGTLLSEIQKYSPPRRKEYNLTNREKQILEEIIEGKTYKEIAEKFSIATSTAKKHILHIYQKLNVRSKVEIVKKVIREKLL